MNKHTKVTVLRAPVPKKVVATLPPWKRPSPRLADGPLVPDPSWQAPVLALVKRQGEVIVRDPHGKPLMSAARDRELVIATPSVDARKCIRQLLTIGYTLELPDFAGLESGAAVICWKMFPSVSAAQSALLGLKLTLRRSGGADGSKAVLAIFKSGGQS